MLTAWSAIETKPLRSALHGAVSLAPRGQALAHQGKQFPDEPCDNPNGHRVRVRTNNHVYDPFEKNGGSNSACSAESVPPKVNYNAAIAAAVAAPAAEPIA